MAPILVDMRSPSENVRTDILLGTQTCASYQVKDIVCNTQFVLIDTPGFDDPQRDDFEILQMIANCINSEECPPISGIVYLQRITDTRMTGDNRLNLEIVKAMCGEKFYNHIVICTSMWNTLPPNAPGPYGKAQERIQSLLDSPTAFKPLKTAGAVHMQFWGEDSSCQGILQLFASMGPAPRMALQKQLTQNRPEVRETDAGYVIEEETKRRARERRDARKRLDTPIGMDEDSTRPRRDGRPARRRGSSPRRAEEGWSFRGVLNMLTRGW